MENSTVLAVDDDQNILNSITLVLEMSGYRVVTAHNPIEALEIMRQNQPELIISDIHMPQMNGFQFYEKVRSNDNWVTIPFIFLSTLNTPENIREGYQLGADHYLPKPFSVEDLTIAVNTKLRRTAEIRSSVEKGLEETKQQLLNVFSHELRTPLSFINGYLSLLEGNLPLSDDILIGMRSGVDRLKNLIGDLMLVFDLENNNIERYIHDYGTPVDVGMEIKEAVEKIKLVAENKKIEIIDNSTFGHTIYGISEYIRDIFYRILDNSIKFSPKEGQVQISLSCDNGTIMVSIKDWGLGISEQDQKHLFNKFHQIDRQRMEQQGIGLGLVIVERLVKLHQGAIVIKSKKDQYTCVELTFPLSKNYSAKN